MSGPDERRLRLAWDRNWPQPPKPPPGGLTAWDYNFLMSLSRWRQPLTSEQRSILRWIAERGGATP